MNFPTTNKNGVVFKGKFIHHRTSNGRNKYYLNAVCPECGKDFETTSVDWKTRRSCKECQPKIVARERIAKSAPMYIRHIRNGMMMRCTNPKNHNYKNYGGRGIKVCARWADVKTGALNMLKDLGERPGAGREWSIDRINNDGDYEPGNCRWATRQEQSLNRRQKAAYDILETRAGKFEVNVYYEGRHYLGSYTTKVDATTAANSFYRALENLHGKTIKTLIKY